MKITTLALLSAATTFAVSSAASAALVISADALTTDVLSQAGQADGGINTRLIDEDANANHARGQLFSLGAAGVDNDSFQITAIAFQKSGATTYVNDVLTLRIFSGNAAAWDAGTGHSTGTDGGDYYVDTTVTPLYEEAYTMNVTIADNDWIVMELSAPITVAENGDYGFFMTYDQVDGTSDDIDHRESQPGTNGNRLSISTTDHGISGARRLDYQVIGTAVPEPGSLALLGLGGLLIARRRRG